MATSDQFVSLIREFERGSGMVSDVIRDLELARGPSLSDIVKSAYPATSPVGHATVCKDGSVEVQVPVFDLPDECIGIHVNSDILSITLTPGKSFPDRKFFSNTVRQYSYGVPRNAPVSASVANGILTVKVGPAPAEPPSKKIPISR